MLEKQIQLGVMRYLKTRGGWWKKISDKFQKGIPDILGCYEGFFIAIEVKQPSGKLTKYQEHESISIDEAEGIYGVVYSIADMREMFEGYIMPLIARKQG